MSNNNNPPPDRVFAVAKRRLNRDNSSNSLSSVGSNSSTSNAFAFGTTSAGINTSQPEPFRFGSPTPPAFGESNVTSFGQPTTAIPTSTTVAAPTATSAQPFQFGGAGNNAFQFGLTTATTSNPFINNRPSTPSSTSSGFQFGASSSSAPFGFGANTAGNTQTTASPFQFGASNTASPFGSGSSNAGSNASTTAFQFGTFNTQPPDTVSTTASAGSFTFTATTNTTTQREESMQGDNDDDMMMDDNNNDQNTETNKPVFGFGSTPPQNDNVSVSSSGSTSFQQFTPIHQQPSDFFSIPANQRSSSTSSSPLVVGSPISAAQMSIQKPPAPPTFGRKDENKSLLSFGTTVADLEDPFNSTPIQKKEDPVTEKKDSEEKDDGSDSSVIVIEGIDDVERKKDDENQTLKETTVEEGEYQVVEPEETNADPKNKTDDEEEIVEVSAEVIEEPSKEDTKHDETSNVEEKEVDEASEVVEKDDETNKKASPEGENEKEHADKENEEKEEGEEEGDEEIIVYSSESEEEAQTQKKKEKASDKDQSNKEESDKGESSTAQTTEKSGSEETNKPAPLFSGFVFGNKDSLSQATSTSATTSTVSDKPPSIIFGNAATSSVTPTVEQAPKFTGFNFGNATVKANLFSGIQPVSIPQQDISSSTSERSGGAIKKKRSSRAGFPYDAGKPKNSLSESSKQTSEAASPFPTFTFGAPKATSSGSTKDSGVKPLFSGFDFSKAKTTAPAEGSKEPEKTSEQAAPKSKFQGFDLGKMPAPKPTAAAAITTTNTTEPPTRKNPFAGFSFYPGGSENKTNDEGSKKATDDTQTTTPAKETPTLTFGSTTTNQPKSSGFTFGQPPSKNTDISKPIEGASPFTFGSLDTASKETTKAPTFGFGSTAPTTSDKAQEPSKAPVLSFGNLSGDKNKAPGSGFGSLTISKEADKPLGFTFGGVAPTTTDKSKAPGFTFGAASNKSSETSKLPTSTFGASSSTDKETTKASPFAAIGAVASTDNSKEASKPSPFTFGTAATSEKSKETNKPSAPTFTFGTSTTDKTSDASKPSAPTFTFGTASTDKTSDANKPPAPTFTFGTTPTDKTSDASKPSAPTFTFGTSTSTEKSSEANKPSAPAFTFGGAISSDKGKEAAKAPIFTFGSTTASDKSKESAGSTPMFTFGDKSKDSADSTSKIPTFGSDKDTWVMPPAPKVSFGTSSVSKDVGSTERSKKKRQLDSDEEDAPPASKKSHFTFQLPAIQSSSTSSNNNKKRQLEDDDEEASTSNKKSITSFHMPLPGTISASIDKTKDDSSKKDQDKGQSFVFGSLPTEKEGESSTAAAATSATTTEKSSTLAELLPKSATTKASNTSPGITPKKPSPLSKEITFNASAKSATKPTGSVATAFSIKDAIENQTLNVQPVKLISSELSAEIGTLKSDMISFSDEVLQTRFWQLSSDVQQNMTVFDAFVNAQIESFKRFEEKTQSRLKDTLSTTTEKIKTLSMDVDTLSKMQGHVTDDVEVFKKRVELQKRNIDAAKDFKTQKNEYLQERDERINWQYIGHIAGEMESRIQEYQDIIPSMEESISKMKDKETPSVGDINNVIDSHGKMLVKLAGRVVNLHDDIQFVRLKNIPPH